jgi:2-hydroxychromene-2-carboxylate isomerase
MSTVEFYFDFSCPWSYMALVRLQDVTERNGAQLQLKPVNVQTVLETENPALVATRLPSNPAKAAWQLQQLGAWARLWGLTIELPASWPWAAPAAANALLAAAAEGRGIEYALAVFHACYTNGVDITAEDELVQLAGAAGLDAANISKGIADPAHTAKVAANTQELIKQGGFGTPSMVINQELFFGNDSVPLVEWTLGPVSDAEFVMPGQHSQL